MARRPRFLIKNNTDKGWARQYTESRLYRFIVDRPLYNEACKSWESLSQWIEQTIPESEWKKLRADIRNANRRVDRNRYSRRITISASAWDSLSQVAKRDGLTPSQAIERYLSRALSSSGK